jgi:hypothetical protein
MSATQLQSETDSDVARREFRIPVTFVVIDSQTDEVCYTSTDFCRRLSLNSARAYARSSNRFETAVEKLKRLSRRYVVHRAAAQLVIGEEVQFRD